MTEQDIISMVERAIEARENSYAPYSKFQVGAALISDNDKLHLGANVENGSFGLTNCAERTAIFSAVTAGMKKIKTIAVVADTSRPVSPCGACREVINEFADDDTVIILANIKKEYKVMNIDELLPYRFKL